LGANAIVGVSGACCKAAAAAKKMAVYEHIGQIYKGKKRQGLMPKPMFNLINGGKHGDTNLDIQEFMVVPTSQTIFGSLRIASEIFHSLQKVLMTRRLSTNLGNEGGYSPRTESNRQALDFIIEAGRLAGYEKGKDFNLALDAAASSFYKEHENHYTLMADKTSLSSERMVSLLKEWVTNYSIISIEDGLAEEDWGGWLNMTERLGRQIMLVGDDLFVTNEARLKKGIEMKVANAVIIKPNQVGTITEAMDTAMLAREHNYKVIASHRSGETNDDFIADFAVGIGADFIKAGSVARGERVAKYNRLLKIEEELG
ncbi:MAG TPA: phosphopyruvate hydratase, partial [Patescibacteria group bacterium]|nr:phosphopyruvate hydratase [Patescibacteria group bacterium]